MSRDSKNPNFLGFWMITALLALAGLLASCWAGSAAPLGSPKNPIKFFFLPSVDATRIADKGRVIEKYLAEHTPYTYKIRVPGSYVAVVEAFGTKRADLATLSAFGYLMARDRYGARAILTSVRFGQLTYKGQIVARADSGINKIEDLQGKRIAFVDPSSASGFLLPSKLLLDHKIHPGRTVFAQKHDNVISMVYQGQVDAGATFYAPPEGGKMQDARRLVLTQYPNVEKVIKIVGLTDEVPNDPIVARKDLPDEIVQTTKKALKEYIETPEGKDVLLSLYGMTGLVETTDARYDAIRDVLKALGKSAMDLVH